MNLKQIYTISSARESIVRIFEEHRHAEPSFSLRSWSRKLGYTNPSTISAVLRGARKLKPDLALRLIRSLTDDSDIADYVETLAHIETTTDDEQREFYLKRLRERHPGAQVQRLNNDAFWYMKEWQHTAILELAGAIVLPHDNALIARLLFDRVSAAVVGDSIHRLQRLGLIEAKGGILHRQVRRLEIFTEGRSAAIRHFHGSGLELARQALEDLPPNERNMQASITCLSREGYRQAVEAIGKLHESICKIAHAERGSQVFSFATQLFPMSRDARSKDRDRKTIIARTQGEMFQ